MSNNSNQNVRVSFPILGLLGVAFIVLKLTGHITWSWVWVLAPFWAPIALAIFILVVAFIIAYATNK